MKVDLTQGPRTDGQVFRSAAKHRQEDTKWKSEPGQTEEKRTSEAPEQNKCAGREIWLKWF